ncbi:hypothetical protein VTN77DRAFT_8339 [Rasamsonia byssochlamydoides]|uniref:uncharacterized protein n=1 Tax=Rasamsonia byssochlamydoides TaxID=89139 RepID=UPI003743DCF2
MASAMSYDESLTKGTFQEIPATVEVLASDISRTCGCDFSVPLEWLRDSWKYIDCGVLVTNVRSITPENSPESDREAARLLVLLKAAIELSAGYGVRTVTLYALGRSAADFGDKLRSCVDTTLVKVTVKTAPHPASVARHHSDLRSPECTLGRPAFCRGLYNLIMSSKKSQDKARESAKERDRQLLAKDLNSLSVNSQRVAESFAEYVSLLERDPDSDVIPKQAALQILKTASECLIEVSVASRNISAFVNLSFPGNASRAVSSAVTKEPPLVLTRRARRGKECQFPVALLAFHCLY